MRRTLLICLLASVFVTSAADAQPYGPPPTVDRPIELVRSWYRRFLDRRPLDQGLLGWANALQQGQSPELVLSQIIGSPEYMLRSGNTQHGFVQNLFSDLLGRRPSPQEYNYWLRRTQFEDHQTIGYELMMRFPGSWRPAGYSPPREEFEHDYRRPGFDWRRP